MTDRVTTQLQSRTADLVTAKGDSDETGLRIGDVIDIKEPAFSLTGNLLDGLQEQNFGSYIITDIMHICDESGNYHNTFDAVPDTVISPPYGNVHSFPVAESQPATVISNDDPAGLGRIQVAFAWQKDAGANTPWIRMTNPHSGGGKGFYFIPEVGEEVLVGFEGGNAEKPFVLGAMYNGSALSEYHTSGNDKNMTFTIGENFNISVGKDMITNIGENRTTYVTLKDKLQAQEAFETIDQNKTVKVSGDLKENTGTTTHKAEQGDIFFQSAGVAKVLGAIDAKVNKG